MGLILYILAPLFGADETTAADMGWLVAGITAGGGFVTVAGGVVLSILKARNDARAQHLKDESERKVQATRDAITQWREIVERQDAERTKLIQRYDAELQQLTAEAGRARLAELVCQEELGEVRAYLHVLWTAYRHLHNESARHGGDPGELIPEPPKRAPRSARVEAAFVNASQRHEAGLLQREKQETTPTRSHTSPSTPPQSPGG